VTRRWLLHLLFVALCAHGAYAQMPQAYERGFAPDKVYQYGEIDHVNHFNGNLVLTIPIGPSFPLKGTSYQLTLVYNSAIWDVLSVSPEDDQHTCFNKCKAIWSYPSRRFNAGQGWTLSLGRKFNRYSVEGAFSGITYQSPDGSDHTFDGSSVTKDGSYIRLGERGVTEIPAPHESYVLPGVESPDGTFRSFFEAPGLAAIGGYGWLSKMRDANDNGIDVEEVFPGPNQPLSEWIIRDTEGRVHHVYFQDLSPLTSGEHQSWVPLPEQRAMVSSVVLQGPAGDMRFTFQYGSNTTLNTLTTIRKSCAGEDHTGFAESFSVPLLNTVTQPDGSTYVATYTGNNDCDPGQLASLVLPSIKGQLQWTYGPYDYPVGSCVQNRYSRTYGVRERRLADTLGNILGKWTYTPAVPDTLKVSMRCPGAGDSGQDIQKSVGQEFTNTVDDPSHLRTIYHFTALPELDGITAQPFISKGEYGFPMSRLYPSSLPAPVRYLSTERQACAPPTCDTSGNCAPLICMPKEYRYIRYITDDTQLSASGDIELVGDDARNPRVESEQTTATESGVSESTWIDRSDFDGFGHYRRTKMTGDFGGSPTRETYVDFNPGADAAGTVASPGGGRVSPFPAGGPLWFLNAFDYSWAGENGRFVKTEACFDSAHAFLSASRTLKNDAATADAIVRNAADIVARYTNASGVISEEKYFGGDRQAGMPDVALCGIAPATPEYKIVHTYSHGTRATTSYYQGAAELLPKVLDRTIDPSGFTASERDSAGLETTFTYEPSGRLKQVSPPGGSPVTYAWTGAVTGLGPIGYLPATLTTERGDVKTIYQYDSLGHLWRELHKVPTGDGESFWSLHQTDFDVLGRKQRDSTFERIADPVNDLGFTPSHAVAYSYSPLGYVTEIAQPDGTSVTFSRTRLSQISKSAPFAASAAVTKTAITTETLNPLQRLTAVSQSIALEPGSATTTYGYDAAGHLSAVAMTRDGITQNRAFAYDGRGVLGSETHPEKGVSGNGTTSYSYDSRGHVVRQTEGVPDGLFDLKFSYDGTERLTTVTEPDPSSTASPKVRRDLKTFDYAFANIAVPGGYDYRAGKLLHTTRHNRDAVLGDISVTETYHYTDAAGHVTQRDTDVTTTGGFSGASFTTTQQWNALDQLTAIGYPITSATAAPARTVTQAYTKGFLTNVGTYASSITYQPSGSPDVVKHGLDDNSSIQKWTPDPDHMDRPCSILVAARQNSVAASPNAPCGFAITGPAASWNTGRYLYDGSGNIRQIGPRSFTYDSLNRITSETDGGLTSTYRYDGFGNLNLQTTTITGFGASDGFFSRAFNPIDVDPATNRLRNVTHDSNGDITSAWENSYEWDSAGALHALHGASGDIVYLYTADDERVASVAIVQGADLATRNRTTWTLRGMANQLLRSWVDDSTGGARAWSWKEDEIWRGTSLLATESQTGARHIFVDHLGSPRFLTDSVGQYVGSVSFSAFGAGGASGVGSLQFTGHERDPGSNFGDTVDYMHARYYRASVARFLSVDPYVDLTRAPHIPQKWNRYAYVDNNPIGHTDPDGKCPDACIVEGLAVAYVAASTPATVAAITETTLGLAALGVAMSEAEQPLPVKGETGGPGKGKRQTKATGDEVRKRDQNKCVFCLTDTNTDKKSNPDKSEIDHSEPKSRDGNNTPNNLQNTCRTCNRDKGPLSTKEYLQKLGASGRDLAGRAAKILSHLWGLVL
jgi:RHS repeat-associated protein